MKTLLFSGFVTLFMLSASFAAPVSEKGPDKVPFFLLVGQSNMAGRGQMEEGDKQVIPDAYLFNAQQAWEPAVPPFNRYAKQKKKIYTGMNPGVGFVKAWGKPVGVVCQARGGTSIGQWLADDSALYAAAISEAKAAQKQGILRGILWHQGESDSSRSEMYPQKLMRLIERFRADLNAPNVPVVFGQLGAWSDKYATFNKMIVKQPEHIPHTGCVTTEDLTAKDSAHFDRTGQLGLGQRYAAAMKKLLAEKN